MKLIPLSKGKFTKVDDDDFELVSQYSWYENEGYAITYCKGKRIRMHRLIMNAPDGVDVDHRDQDKLNNQKYNLRFCTTTQNNRNVRLHKNNTTGYKGVSIEPSTGYFRPNVYKDGVAISFGNFKDIHHAALARDLWAVDLYGEFASTNFPVVSFGP
jgi:HNH endonuclease